MVSGPIKKSALAGIKKRHPSILLEVTEKGAVLLPASRRLAATRDMALHHREKGFFHPIAAYNRSVAKLSRRASAVADLLFENERAFRNQATPAGARTEILKVYDGLLDRYESYLFAVDSHFDDVKNIALCFYREPAKKVDCASFKRIRSEFEVISTATSYAVNKIKHNLGSLSGFHSVAANAEIRVWVPGFMLTRVVDDAVGADPAFAGFENSAISIYTDLRRSLSSLIVASQCLADFLDSRGVAPLPDEEPIVPFNEPADILLAVSRLCYPTERHEFVCDCSIPALSSREHPCRAPCEQARCRPI